MIFFKGMLLVFPSFKGHTIGSKCHKVKIDTATAKRWDGIYSLIHRYLFGIHLNNGDDDFFVNIQGILIKIIENYLYLNN